MTQYASVPQPYMNPSLLLLAKPNLFGVCDFNKLTYGALTALVACKQHCVAMMLMQLHAADSVFPCIWCEGVMRAVHVSPPL